MVVGFFVIMVVAKNQKYHLDSLMHRLTLSKELICVNKSLVCRTTAQTHMCCTRNFDRMFADILLISTIRIDRFESKQYFRNFQFFLWTTTQIEEGKNSKFPFLFAQHAKEQESHSDVKWARNGRSKPEKNPGFILLSIVVCH